MKKLAITFITIFILTNCATAPVNGILYSKVTFPGEFNHTNDVKNQKSGKSCSHAALGLVSWGNASAGSTAKKNGILKISTIDHESMNILFGIYRRYCTFVYGE
ncbi:MAG: TRL-like family protein [Spirochaetota bacterium]